MTKITVYFDGFFNDSKNYVSYRIFEIFVNELKSFKDLHNILRSKFGSYTDINNIDIYLCVCSIECLKKDLTITNNNDVK